MKILVTGATGFLGKRTCEILASQGHQVVGIGRNRAKSPSGIKFMQADLTRLLPPEAWQGVDAVVHCAAKSSVWGKYDDFYQNNVVATRLLAEQALQQGVKRFVHISSTSVYFDSKNHQQITEDMPLPKQKANHYAETKFLAEQEVLKFVRKGLPCIILRPRAIFGVGDSSLLPRLLKVNKEKFFPEFTDNGGPLTDITYVDNVVEAIICALQAPTSCYGKIYNITNGESILIQQTVKQLVENLGYTYHGKRIPFALAKMYAYFLEKWHQLFCPKTEPPFTTYSIGLIAKSQTFCIDKARRELGYQPKVTITQGLSYVTQRWKH